MMTASAAIYVCNVDFTAACCPSLCYQSPQPQHIHIRALIHSVQLAAWHKLNAEMLGSCCLEIWLCPAVAAMRNENSGVAVC